MPRAVRTLYNSSKSKYKSLYQYLTIQKNRLQYHQNKLFKTNQSRLYSKLSGDKNSIIESLDAQEATSLWKDIWATPAGHKRNTEQLREVKKGGKTCKDMAKSLSHLRMGNMESERWQVRKPLDLMESMDSGTRNCQKFMKIFATEMLLVLQCQNG